MASKSKKRRRVLGASCILAALIIAGSSFAWFTSKDEVTNRLTASSDYGVSIVESFTPPVNMVPGQEVNKDVYAVNTGTIGAFVKESVSGKLNYTYEKRVADAPLTTPNTYVQLDENVARAIDGSTSQEAGGYLAWTSVPTNDPNYTPPGPIISATITDANDTNNVHGQVDGERWTPKATGVYIFRRAIDTTDPDNPEFSYAGYYFVKGSDTDSNTSDDWDETQDRYYKIVLGNDAFRTYEENSNDVFDVSVKESQLGANLEFDNTTGVITGGVQYQFVKDITVNNAKPMLQFFGGAEDPAYLIASYTDTANSTNTDLQQKEAAAAAALKDMQQKYIALLKAQGDAAVTEREYENALGAYNTAKSRYDQIVADYTYAKALKDATDKLYQAAHERANSEIAMDQKKNAMDSALSALKEEAEALLKDQDASGYDSTKNFGDLFKETDVYGLVSDSCAISAPSIFGGATANDGDLTTLNGIINGGTWGTTPNSVTLLQEINNYRAKMYSTWATIKEYAGKVKADLDKFATLDSERTDGINDGDQAQEYLATLKNELKDNIAKNEDALCKALNEYKELYRAFKVVSDGTPVEEKLTQLETGNDISATIADWDARANGLYDAIKRDTTGLEALVNAYEKAYDEYLDQIQNVIPQAQNKWKQAVTTYNNTVDKARDEYNGKGDESKGAINKDQITNDVNGHASKNNYEGLVQKTSGGNYKLTDNNNTLVGKYAADKEVKEDPQVTDTKGDLWKTIGRTDTTLGSVQAQYTEVANGEDTYRPAVNNAINDRDDFVQVNPTQSKTLKQLSDALDDATTPKTTAETNYTTDQAELKAAQKAYNDAIVANNAAQSAAQGLADADESTIKFKIYLADTEAALDWTSALNDQESAQKADFYYNYILDGGQTSEKLIDSVQLMDSVTAKDYKDLTFDLNVTLDSAQITYENDQRTINDTAVANNNLFTIKVKNIDQEHPDATKGIPVEWNKAGVAASANPLYFVGLESINAPTTVNIADPADADKPYTYMITLPNSDKYVGKSNADGATFYKYTEGGTPAVNTDTSVKLTKVTPQPVADTTTPPAATTGGKGVKTYKFDGDDIAADAIVAGTFDVTAEAAGAGEVTDTYSYMITSGSDKYVSHKNDGSEYFVKYDDVNKKVDTAEQKALAVTTTTYMLGAFEIDKADIMADDTPVGPVGNPTATYKNYVELYGDKYVGQTGTALDVDDLDETGVEFYKYTPATTGETPADASADTANPVTLKKVVTVVSPT